MTPNSVNNAYGSALRSMALWLPFIRAKIKESDEEIARLAPPARVAALSIGDDTTDEPLEETTIAALPASTSLIRDVVMEAEAEEDDDDQQKPQKTIEDEWT